MKKVIIMNAVPTNNGDAALVLGLRDKLIEQGYEVWISTTKYDIVKKMYPDVLWEKADYDFSPMYYRMFRILPGLKKYILKRRVKKKETYRDADFVIGAPGGYINSYYGIEEKLYCMKLIKEFYDTKLVMYSQSVGPLNEADKKILDDYMNMFELFMARDDISYENVKQYKNCIKTNDAAFLLDNQSCNEDKTKESVAVSVREWSFDDRSKEKYITLMKALVEKCIDSGKNVEFISTCQGLENYVDDSKMAEEIVSRLDEKYKNHVVIDNQYHTLYQLRDKIKKYDFVIGTRLHMCILTMLAGIPAMNISYEVKGKECFRMLGFEKYSLDYNSDVKEGLEVLQDFMENINDLTPKYREKIADMNQTAERYFEYMVNEVFDK